VYNHYNQPPKFPWWAFIGIFLVALWSSGNAKKSMDKMNSGAPDEMYFLVQKSIMDNFEIADNEFSEIKSIK
jgi:hypothetical protein